MKYIINWIEKAYGITVESYAKAPRGFWAETYYINTDNDIFFLKIHNNYPWKAVFMASVDIQYQMAQRIKYIAAPLMSRKNTTSYVLDDGRTAALYTYIDGESYATRDACEVLRLLADIYTYTTDIKCDNIYTYKLYPDKFCSESPVLKEYLCKNRDIYIKYRKKYEALADMVCNTDRKRYLTHGDIATNLMIDLNRQVYIIDWDRIRLGPIELDLYEFIDNTTDIRLLDNIVENACPGWRFNKDYHNYFILNDLYYNLRNLLNTGGDGITPEDLSAYQQYIDNLDSRLLL